jgi:hypothetical protein
MGPKICPRMRMEEAASPARMPGLADGRVGVGCFLREGVGLAAGVDFRVWRKMEMAAMRPMVWAARHHGQNCWRMKAWTMPNQMAAAAREVATARRAVRWGRKVRKRRVA